MKISVVIPTKNEEKWLHITLESLREATQDSEIIIVDNDCGYESKLIAEKFNCSIRQGTTPAISRNIGANIASGELIIFIDADVVISKKHIDMVKEIFNKDSNIGVVHFKIDPMSDSWFINTCYNIMNQYFRILHSIGFSQGIGNYIAVRKEVYRKVGGFDEDILVGEDADFFRRVNKITDVSFIYTEPIYASARRFYLENPYVFATKCLLWALLRTLGLRVSIFEYKWGKYASILAEKDREWVRRKEIQQGLRSGTLPHGSAADVGGG